MFLRTQSLCLLGSVFLLSTCASSDPRRSAPAAISDSWYRAGAAAVEEKHRDAARARALSDHPARNIILFVGDGMGISTVTAARIYAGQRAGQSGESNQLSFERFENLALSKTYNSNQQVPDSAGTMSAMMTGVKTDAGVISLNEQAVRGDCRSAAGNAVMSALEYAEIQGKATGIVTTARITHATPAATYAKSVDRDYESDADVDTLSHPEGCEDIASQLISFPERLGAAGYTGVDGLEVAFGGGREGFLPDRPGADPEDGLPGHRQDGRDLTQAWLDSHPRAAYVWNRAQLDALDIDRTDHVLGLFEMSHMEYELDRAADRGGEPSLPEMTSRAIEMLSRNPRGFFLHVEAGRIDHAHHNINPSRALEEVRQLSEAVRVAREMTDPEETLIIVTADHSHVFTIGGYPTRGNPILGKVVENDASGRPRSSPALARDGMPYTTLGYQNGRGFRELPDADSADAIEDLPVRLGGRADLSEVDTTHKGFHSEVLVPLDDETHGGEDVAIYATGPGSSLVNGVMEQNEIFHVMVRAGRLIPSD